MFISRHWRQAGSPPPGTRNGHGLDFTICRSRALDWLRRRGSRPEHPYADPYALGL